MAILETASRTMKENTEQISALQMTQEKKSRVLTFHLFLSKRSMSPTSKVKKIQIGEMRLNVSVPTVILRDG